MITALREMTSTKEDRTPTVLCIDDDLDVLNAIEQSLRKFDVKLLQAVDGMEAFGEAMLQKPDVVVMDLDMPYGNGMMMLECFRGELQTQATPIIILTGMGGSKLKQKAISLGVNRFLQKPCAFEKLRREMEQFITLRERSLDPDTASGVASH